MPCFVLFGQFQYLNTNYIPQELLLLKRNTCPQGFEKSFRRLRARKRNRFVDDIERHAGNAEHPCPLFFLAHGGRTFFVGEEAFQRTDLFSGWMMSGNSDSLVTCSGTGTTIHLVPRLKPDGPGSVRISPVSRK